MSEGFACGATSVPLCYNSRMCLPSIRRALVGACAPFMRLPLGTRLVLAVRVDGGPDGGTFTLTPRNIGKLAPEGGTGPLSLPSGWTLAPGETYSATFECSGVEASGAEGDVAVSASFTDAG